MAGADLTGAALQDANLRDTNLAAVSFRDADLRGTWLQGAVIDQTDFAGAIFTSPSGNSTATSGFVESIPELTPGNHYTAVDFSRGLNLSPEQLTFICAQGGIHPACEAFTP